MQNNQDIIRLKQMGFFTQPDVTQLTHQLTHTMFAGSKKTSFHIMNLLQEEAPPQQRGTFTVHHLPAKQSNIVSIMHVAVALYSDGSQLYLNSIMKQQK